MGTNNINTSQVSADHLHDEQLGWVRDTILSEAWGYPPKCVLAMLVLAAVRGQPRRTVLQFRSARHDRG